ncbi:unannotated protein [freshwater metagenome]|uniref:Unannotated protein n=1 Tax=freshwater metagenome TaxID=449393 RepID=A0A6J7RTW4_9ZZZZ|nr:DUF881 domain-containing protein [Actinomycetota bacterium]MSW35965.1 DUF881 domain-containing protein [Actinomycetota bacterium]MSX37725.1 DUF881 domain-containing protein [Actinomycetota bacterium]
MATSSGDRAASMALLRDLLRDDAALDYVEATRVRRLRDQGSVGRHGPTWLLAATCVLVAGILAIGLVQRRADEPQATQSRDALAARAALAQQNVDLLESEVASARVALSALGQRLLAESDIGQELTSSIESLSAIAGYSAIAGPGVVVVLDDAKGIDRNDLASPGRVMDRDVQTVVNGLWQAGAEAVTINGRRLTATSAIRAAGAAILVDFKPVLAPYRIEAIGDPNSLASAYASTRSAADLSALAEAYGLRVTTETVSTLTLGVATSGLPTIAEAQHPVGANLTPSLRSPGGTS